MSGKTVAIVQSCYIPWKGYFDLVNGVDEFILYDDVQFTRRDWRNRNRIKTPHGVRWLTIPVAAKGRYHQRIDETLVADPDWASRHWRTLQHAYAAAPHFDELAPRFAATYDALSGEPRLSAVNRTLIEAVGDLLGISTRLSWSTDYNVEGQRTQRLVELCRVVGAERDLSGPSARDYLDESLFAEHDIAVTYMDYSGYAVYDQLYPPFEHTVTILDLLFHVGDATPRYMKSFFAAAEMHAR